MIFYAIMYSVSIGVSAYSDVCSIYVIPPLDFRFFHFFMFILLDCAVVCMVMVFFYMVHFVQMPYTFDFDSGGSLNSYGVIALTI